MLRHRQVALLSFVLIALTCLTMLAPLASVAQDRTEAPESTVSEPPAEGETPTEETDPPDDSDPQPTVPESDEAPSPPEIELQTPVLSVNGAQSSLDVTESSFLTAIAGSLNEGASYSLSISAGFGCGGGQQFGLGTGPGQLSAEIGTLVEGSYSAQAIDATNNLYSNCVNITVVPAVVEEPTDEPAPTDEPIPTDIPATEIPTEEPPTPTSEPPTAEPTVEPSATATTELTPSPTIEQTPTADASPTSEPSDFNAAGLPIESYDVHGLFINGSEGPVFLTSGQTANILVQDFTDMAEGRAEYEDDFVNTNWHAYSEVTIGGGSCASRGAGSTYTLDRQPNYTWTSSTTLSDPGNYWFVARQGYTYVVGIGTTGRLATSICIDVVVSSSKPALAANGSTNLQVNEDVQVGFTATGIPAEAHGLELVQWSGGGCGLGTATVLTTNLPTGFDNLTGSNHFELKAYVAGTLWATSNCVFVRIANVNALLRENGSTGPILYQTGQSFYLIATNFAPAAPLTLSVYEGTGCSQLGFRYRYTAGSADVEGTSVFSSFTGLSNEAASFSVQVNSPSETTNCVAFNRIEGSPRLTVNGSTGPFVVGEPTLFELDATGLPPNVESHLITCSGTILDEFGGTTNAQGEDSGDWLVTEEISLAFTAAGVTTNCIYFNYIDASEYSPIVTVNGGPGPEAVAVDEPFQIGVTGLAGDAAFFMQRFPESGDCTGAQVEVVSTANSQGEYAISISESVTGDISYRVSFGGVLSNCVSIEVVDAIDVKLAINGQSSPLAVSTTTSLNVVASGLPGNLASAATVLRQYSGSDCGGDAPFNLATANTNASGVFDLTLSPLPAGTWSFRVDLTDRPGVSNCVNVTVSEPVSTDPHLTINGFAGFVAVLEGASLDFDAINVPDSSGTTLQHHTGFDCTGTSADSIDPGAARPVAYTGSAPARGQHSYRVTTSGPASVTNCVNLLVSTPEEEVDPYLLVNDSFGPVQVEDGQTVVFNAAAFTTDATMQLMAYATLTCSDSGSAWPGDSTQAPNGGVFIRSLPVPAGVLGAKVTSGDGETNCVGLPRASVEPGTGAVSITVQTSDGQDIPDSGQICIDSICQSIGTGDLAASAESGATYTFETVAEGNHVVTVVDVQPYESASVNVEVVTGQVTAQAIVLQVTPVTPTTEPDDPSPTPTTEPDDPSPTATTDPDDPSPTATTDPDDPSPTITPPVNDDLSTPPGEAVRGLPVTGSGTLDNGSPLAALMMLILTVTTLAALVTRRIKAA